MNFKVGDTVSVLDDDITGNVVNIIGQTITILSTDDFEFNFETHELVRVNNEVSLETSLFKDTSLNSIIEEKESSVKQQSKKLKPKDRAKPILTVDLHIHKLVDSVKNMTNHDMLNLQLNTAKRQLEFAIQKHIQKLVFIHGVGEGVLKMELETMLRRYNNLKFYDADYKNYGYGATEVYIFQNVKP
ncbi:DNA mismatch repair protein MutS [Ichthyenterobacterium sp. W332]|uniref:DNA mismatch repair protein MutS n=1 Tax=Microcosmobacter mediterraneus TaxID=3075607 RepID=A0ABU2YGY9_9FLAO|nr:Smr/MutS family protein [Ichthyenterobacterium sp. W332]MDT0557435.1 DNA mismatch repair protein MutS [Ichthyenterobacterium sp. W332]